MDRITGMILGLLAVFAVGSLACALVVDRRRRRDAAERAVLAARLGEIEARLRFVDQHGGDVTWTLDLASGRMTELGPAVYRLLGYRAEEILAAPGPAALLSESAAELKLLLADLSARWQAGDRQATRTIEVAPRHQDGHRVATAVVLTVYGDDTGPRTVFGISRPLGAYWPVAAAPAPAAGGEPGDRPGAAVFVAPESDRHGDASPLLRFYWRSAYESGLPALDREHRALFEDANQLLAAALENAADKAPFMASVDRLLNHVQQHFADEEVLLQQIAYPELLGHAKRHRELVLQATHLRAEAAAGRIGIGDWVDFIANDVIVGHIIREDRKFFSLLALATGDQGRPGAHAEAA